MDMQIVGAIKIKDGLFIGDEYAAKDLEFIVTNKVTHIINSSGTEIPNVWESIGVQYLTFPWIESDQQIIFDQNDQNVQEIYNFIEDSIQLGESCLVHSVKGQSRSCCVLAAYFMIKFRWSLYKTLEYLNSRRSDLEIRASFFHQLTNLENKLARSGRGAKTGNWNDLGFENSVQTGEQQQNLHMEELLLRNTFLNSKNSPVDEIFTDLQKQNQLLSKPDHKPKIIINERVAAPPLKKHQILQSCLKGQRNKSKSFGSHQQLIQQQQQNIYEQQGTAIQDKPARAVSLTKSSKNLEQNLSEQDQHFNRKKLPPQVSTSMVSASTGQNANPISQIQQSNQVNQMQKSSSASQIEKGQNIQNNIIQQGVQNQQGSFIQQSNQQNQQQQLPSGQQTQFSGNQSKTNPKNQSELNSLEQKNQNKIEEQIAGNLMNLNIDLNIQKMYNSLKQTHLNQVTQNVSSTSTKSKQNQLQINSEQNSNNNSINQSGQIKQNQQNINNSNLNTNYNILNPTNLQQQYTQSIINQNIPSTNNPQQNQKKNTNSASSHSIRSSSQPKQQDDNSFLIEKNLKKPNNSNTPQQINENENNKRKNIPKRPMSQEVKEDSKVRRESPQIRNNKNSQQDNQKKNIKEFNEDLQKFEINNLKDTNQKEINNEIYDNLQMNQNYLNGVNLNHSNQKKMYMENKTLSQNQNQNNSQKSTISIDPKLKKIDSSNMMGNQQIQQQMNQINSISSNLMKSLQSFQQQQQISLQQQNSQINLSNPMNLSNNNSFSSKNIQKGQPIRAKTNLLSEQLSPQNLNQNAVEKLKIPLQNNFLNEKNNNQSKENQQPSVQNENLNSNQNSNNRPSTAPRTFSPGQKAWQEIDKSKQVQLQQSIPIKDNALNYKQRGRSSSPGSKSNGVLDNSYKQQQQPVISNQFSNIVTNPYQKEENNIFTFNNFLLNQNNQPKPKWKF